MVMSLLALTSTTAVTATQVVNAVATGVSVAHAAYSVAKRVKVSR